MIECVIASKRSATATPVSPISTPFSPTWCCVKSSFRLLALMIFRDLLTHMRWCSIVRSCRGALEEVLKRGRVFEKLDRELRELRRSQQKDPAEAAAFEAARVQAGTSRQQVMDFVDLLTLDDGSIGVCASTF